MATSLAQKNRFEIKQPKGLSPRIQWLRDYYFAGVERPWNNEFTAWTTGTPWDVVFNEADYYIVPEMYAFMQTFCSSFPQAARPVALPPEFWKWSLPERRAWFVREVIVHYLPVEILPGDLLCGARFNIQASRCLDKGQARKRNSLLSGPKGARRAVKRFHDTGYGNAGATSGHLIPDYASVLAHGFKGIYDDLKTRYEALGRLEKYGAKGAQLRAMMIAATMPRDLSKKYVQHALDLAKDENDQTRRAELMKMAENCSRVPWLAPRDFWEAVQALWITHMLVLSDENYPGPGVSFGRIDQYLLPFWEESLAHGMDREWGKEILKCFWIHCNTAYDAMIRTGGNQGITAGFGQLITLSGMGPNGCDLTNDLTWAFLEVIDEMTPILEPKPNVRLHANTPEVLLDKVVDMIANSQGAPFLLNFDERAMAGMLREAKMAGLSEFINESTVHDYAPVGCMENTMAGNDRSGTVDMNLNLLKAVELVLGSGKALATYKDPIMGKAYPLVQEGPNTGDPRTFGKWEQFWKAFEIQMRFIIKKCVEIYDLSESVRKDFHPTPYLSCLVKGCAQKAKDVTQGAAQISLVTLEAVTYATTVDSLLAVKHLVYDTKACTMDELITALKSNWAGHEVLQARAKFKAPKYGREEDEADQMALAVMELWTGEAWKHTVPSTKRRVRPGMLSWNYWVGDGYILPASPDGRPKGQFLSNAICPVNGMDTKGPTANTNSVGKALGGFSEKKGDYKGFCNSLPNGASHTITFNPALLADPEHRAKFTAYLKSYTRNGGTALQVNMLDATMLKDAQKNPTDYRHLLVRVTGYNAYFTSIGKELQDEVIARISHSRI